MVVALSMLLPWFSAGDHALFSPDEGRYASVAMHMVDGGGWLVPEFKGQPHLTKPPLTYWLIGVSIKALGPSSLAVRAPSLVAGSLCVLIVFLIGLSWRGPTVGAIAAGVLGVMPLFELVTRFAVTDPLLNLFWTGALGAGWMATRRDPLRWAALFWTCTALGLMAKGPAALIPALILLIWLLLARNKIGLKRLHVWTGLPLSVLPVIAWGLGVLATNDDALAIWRHEVFDRAVGTGDHSMPVWFFAPVFLGGLYPATAMLVVPGFNITWRRAWRNLRDGETAALWAVAAVVPVVIFSLIAGKLPSYILPACAPIALLTAEMLWRRATRSEGPRPPGFKREPDVVVTLAITAWITAVVGIAAAIHFGQLTAGLVIALGLGPVVSLIVWAIWRRARRQRPAALLLAWAGALVVWGLIFEEEDRFTAIASPEVMIERLTELEGGPVGRVAVYGFHDPSLWFYLWGRVRQVTPEELASGDSGRSLGDIILVEQPKWKAFAANHPDAALRFEVLGSWRRRWTHPTLILRPRSSEVPAPSRAPGESRGGTPIPGEASP